MNYFLKCFLVILNGAELDRRIDELLSAVGDSNCKASCFNVSLRFTESIKNVGFFDLAVS